MQRFSYTKYQLAIGGMLVAASMIAVVLQMIQQRVVHVNIHNFLTWNLMLAWIPFLAAIAAYAIRRFRGTHFLILPICVILWLIFFPNAPYLLTDLEHLAYYNANSPLWLDVIILLWFAWTGLMLGIASLYLIQEIMREFFGARVSWIFAIGATILSSIGVYMGRILRWNSWDLLNDPYPIAQDMFGIVRHPLANFPTYVFTILFTLLFLFIYVTFHLFGGLLRESGNQKDPSAT